MAYERIPAPARSPRLYGLIPIPLALIRILLAALTAFGIAATVGATFHRDALAALGDLILVAAAGYGLLYAIGRAPRRYAAATCVLLAAAVVAAFLWL